MSVATPLFLLQTARGCLEVARFKIKDWGISRHYSIELFLREANQELQINEQVTLQVDDQCYHGLIQEICQSPSSAGGTTRLKLCSLLEAKLHCTQSRVYSQLNLSQLIKQLLTEAGLFEGLDFELALSQNKENIWLLQDNESGLAFFNRIMTLYGLVFITRQEADHAVCLISDSLESLPKSPCIPLSMEAPSGLNQKESINQFSLSGDLSHAVLAVRDYDSKQATCRTEQRAFKHASARGVRGYHGHVSLESLNPIESIGDEPPWTMHLISQSLVKPAQFLELKGARGLERPYMVYSVQIVGQQKEGMGAEPIEEQEDLHQSRLLYYLDLHLNERSPFQHDLGQIKPTNHFSTAKIEHRPGPYPDLSPSGEYHVRLQVDEHPNQHELYPSSAKTKASPRLRNALYFAGNDYGLSHPYADGSEVILAYENGQQQRPIVMAALPNKNALSVVADKNSNESIIASAYGSYLRFKDEENGVSIELATADKNNSFYLKQEQELAEFKVESRTGEIHLKALEGLIIQTQGQYQQQSALHQQLWIEEDADIKSEKGHVSIEADQTTSLHALEELRLHGIEQNWTAKEQIRLEAYQEMHLKSEENMTLLSEQGRQHWRNLRGMIYIQASKRLILKAGGSSIELNADSIDFQTPGVFRLNAKEVHGLG